MNTSLETSNHSIITSHIIKSEQVSDNLFNISVTLLFEYLPGEAVYTVAAQTESDGVSQSTYSVVQTHAVYGMAFYDDSHGTMALISGDFGYGLSLLSSSLGELARVKYIANVPRDVKLNPTASVLFNPYQEPILEDNDLNIDDATLSVNIRPYRVGSALIVIESSNLVVGGESFETVLIVRVRGVSNYMRLDS